MCPGKLSPKRDSTTQAPRTILRKAMLCITTCAMRHSADHRHSCLPLLVRQRAHIDHSNTYHIYHNILRFVNTKYNILCFTGGKYTEFGLAETETLCGWPYSVGCTGRFCYFFNPFAMAIRLSSWSLLKLFATSKSSVAFVGLTVSVSKNSFGVIPR